MLSAIPWWALVVAFFSVCTALVCALAMYAVDEEKLGLSEDDPLSPEAAPGYPRPKLVKVRLRPAA